VDHAPILYIDTPPHGSTIRRPYWKIQEFLDKFAMFSFAYKANAHGITLVSIWKLSLFC
jgi:hypothetical protein